EGKINKKAWFDLLIVAELDLSTTVLGKKNGVAFLDRDRNQFPILIPRSRPHCYHLAGVQLGGFLWEEDAALGFGRLDDSLHQDAVERWDQTLHHFSLSLGGGGGCECEF
ncbi:hypothetical protein IGI04_038599, partial [Brassica rapa subsp. trilocularis]